MKPNSGHKVKIEKAEYESELNTPLNTPFETYINMEKSENGAPITSISKAPSIAFSFGILLSVSSILFVTSHNAYANEVVMPSQERVLKQSPIGHKDKKVALGSLTTKALLPKLEALSFLPLREDRPLKQPSPVLNTHKQVAIQSAKS